jgi:hypothetical protein
MKSFIVTVLVVGILSACIGIAIWYFWWVPFHRIEVPAAVPVAVAPVAAPAPAPVIAPPPEPAPAVAPVAIPKPQPCDFMVGPCKRVVGHVHKPAGCDAGERAAYQTAYANAATANKLLGRAAYATSGPLC